LAGEKNQNLKPEDKNYPYRFTCADLLTFPMDSEFAVFFRFPRGTLSEL